MKIRVYYEDTDSGGVVYHANYLNFMERARTEWLRDLGVNQHSLKIKDNVMFVVANMAIKFKKSAVLDDELTVHTKLLKLKPCSLDLIQDIFKGNELLIHSSITVACIDASQLKPLKIPTEIKKLMETL